MMRDWMDQQMCLFKLLKMNCSTVNNFNVHQIAALVNKCCMKVATYFTGPGLICKCSSNTINNKAISLILQGMLGNCITA